MGTLRREETLNLSCACLKNYPRIIKKRSRINQKEQEEESYPKTINFSAHSLRTPLSSSLSCTQEGRSILERGVQNSRQLSHRHQNPLCNLEGSEVYKGRCTFSFQHSLPPSPPHTHTHTRMRQTPDTPLS